jgi:UDP-N-acetylmuramate--alanine ligase
VNHRIEDISSVYFVGIGGIGMSAIARYFLSRGASVSGYDRSSTSLTRELEELGARVSYIDDASDIPASVDLAVYTPAIPKESAILSHFRSAGPEPVKRSEVLEMISRDSFNICIAGTHGKTTVSTMVAHMLRHSGYGCNAFLGGISSNYGTNFWGHERNVCVIEADEYDRSFLRLSPDIAVVTAMDPDHLDIYGTGEAMEEAFIAFSKAVKPGGTLIAQSGLPRLNDLAQPVTTYSLEDTGADIHASGPVPRNGAYHYDVRFRDHVLTGLTLHMGGAHNVENSLAALAVGRILGLTDGQMRDALADFKGVRRRFEYRFRSPNVTYIDDYAHHPRELEALVSGARKMFPGRRITLVFQPHLFSRTRDFAEGFARSLDMADEVLLLPIYPAREKPMPGVESRTIGGLMHTRLVYTEGMDAVLHWLDHNPVEVLITAGAGDIDQLAEPIAYQLRKRNDARRT